MQSLDKHIDNLVYELYGLTEEEIMIVDRRIEANIRTIAKLFKFLSARNYSC
ncbi:MAG: hypothetical protein IPH11_15080 [Ignavibacteriales bacterium]|nr:hypothetical protein [Ignavibacteriales bacterium]